MAPADWYPDPVDPTLLRYWDGVAWTAHTAPRAAAPVDTLENHLRRVGDQVVVSSVDVGAGLAPERCVAHHRTGAPTSVQFISRTPVWVWVTIVLGLIVPLLIALVIRKTVTSPAWPACELCVSERRANRRWMWVSIASWVPGFVLLASLPSSLPDAISIGVILLVVLGPLVAAVWFNDRASLGRQIRGVVSSDGLTVSFPSRVFPATVRGTASVVGGVSVLPH